MALFPLVAISGLGIAFGYRPVPEQAWWSVASIAGGDLSVLRDLHRWAGELLLVAAWLHLFRVFMVGAYRRLPGWGLSVALTVLVVASSASGWALRFDAGAARTVGEDSLVAIYVLHVVLLPAAVFGAVWIYRRSRDREPVIPSEVATAGAGGSTTDPSTDPSTDRATDGVSDEPSVDVA